MTRGFELIFESFLHVEQVKAQRKFTRRCLQYKKKQETNDEKTSVLGYLRMSKLEQIFKKVITTKKDSTSQFSRDYALNKWKVMKSLGEALYKYDKEESRWQD